MGLTGNMAMPQADQGCQACWINRVSAVMADRSAQRVDGFAAPELRAEAPVKRSHAQWDGAWLREPVLSLVQILRSMRPPSGPDSGPSIRIQPFGCTCQSQLMTVPSPRCGHDR
jgi:hypothetical protein